MRLSALDRLSGRYWESPQTARGQDRKYRPISQQAGQNASFEREVQFSAERSLADRDGRFPPGVGPGVPGRTAGVDLSAGHSSYSRG